MQGQHLPDAVAELIEAADSLPFGRSRLEVLEQAARVADAHRDVAAGFAVRRRLIDEAAFCMRYDLYAVAFVWCLAAARAEPERFSLADLLDRYQHVIGKMVNFPDVGREQYEALFTDVVRELGAHGFSLRTVYLERRSVAIDFADREMAEGADREWRRQRRDELSASVEFELARQLEHECFRADNEAAVRVVDEYFARRRRDRAYDPWFCGISLLPLLLAGREADAAALYPNAAQATARGAGYIWSQGCHLEYLGRVGDFGRGVREFEAQLPAALAQPDPLSRYYCLRPALLLFERMAAKGVRTVDLKPPRGVPWGKARGVYEVSAVRDWIAAEASAIAAQFDRRNGNGYYTEWLRRSAAPDG